MVEGRVTRGATLTPFCSTGTGKLAEGMEVSHRRKPGLTLDDSFCIFSTVCSSFASHDTAK